MWPTKRIIPFTTTLVAAVFTLSHLARGTEAIEIPRIVSISQFKSVVAALDGKESKVEVGQRIGRWTLMGIIHAKSHPLGCFEEFSQLKVALIFRVPHAVKARVSKSLEPVFASSTNLYHGHSLEEVFNSERDLLGEEVLAKPGDPNFADVAASFPPISKMYTYTFVGTHECLEKVGIFYGGSTPNFDPAAYVPEIEKIRSESRVMDGLVGGWLPAIRFVYPEKPGDWSELIIYAAMRVETGNQRIQPLRYRLTRIESNTLRWVRYFDSYHPFPPRLEHPAEPFYEELLQMSAHWDQALTNGMHIDIPDQRLANMSRHSLVRDMITRVGAFPKYGVFDRGYAGSEHDGFPDTFTTGTTAMLEWGLFDLARQYIDNYFTFFVRDDGSILYRGPETGQFGRILTVIAEYVNCTSDFGPLLRHRHRIDAITRLLLSLRSKSSTLPPDDPAFGLIAGWSEADSCLDSAPARYMQPYISNSAEAARGFDEMGSVWERVGHSRCQPELVAWGRQLRQESQSLRKDIQHGISLSMLTNTQPPFLPAIAGVKEPFHIAVARDKSDPQFRSYRAYEEMLYSGILSREQVQTIVNYRAAHHDIILGIPTVYGYNSHEWGGFLSYGHCFGLLQHDFLREYLLTLFSLMAHRYTRGTWTAPETRNVDPKKFTAPYCSPAQLVVPLLTRWMLVFEDPQSQTRWLAKATPRSWLEDGQTISVSNAPTRWGQLSYNIKSHIQQRNVEVVLKLPARPISAQIKLRLRVPENHRIQTATLNGRPWHEFDPDEETVSLPSRVKGELNLIVTY